MPKLAANISWLYTEHAPLDRFQAAADDGFQAVEMLFPYEHAPEELARAREAAGVAHVLINMPPGHWKRGERGLGALPGRGGEFAAGITRTIEYADALGCRLLHAMAGVVSDDANRRSCTDVFCENLEAACEVAGRHGMTVTIEPINDRDIPGYFLTRQDQAMEVIDRVGAGNLKLQMDFYHCQIMEGDPAPLLKRNIGSTGHMQIAGVDGRHEPETGAPDTAGLFRLIDDLDYDGWVACEYAPRTSTTQGLGWARPWLSGA